MEKETILTKEGHKKVMAELEELRSKRKDIAERIQEAKDLGDLSENAEYHEAKNEQAFVEGRIAELEDTINNAKIVKSPSKNSDLVQVGSSVVAEVEGKEVTYTIVGANEADPTAGKISNESPLGSLFLGKRKGESITIATQKGDNTYTIVSIS